MNENKSKSLENLLPKTTTKLVQIPIQYETYRNDLHHELAKHWPFDRTKLSSIPSKSTIVRSENESLEQIFQKTRTKKLNDSQFSLNKRYDWNLKAQEGIITYHLPDSLPDGQALHAKLNKLMQMNTLNLNDRQFWTRLENRFKKLRKVNVRLNMQRLRQNQQQYEQDLISQGLIPHTTEDAIKQRRIETTIKKIPMNNSIQKNCLIDSFYSTNRLTKFDECEMFENDNVYPNLHKILNDYKFQTQSGKQITDEFQEQLYQIQTQIKSIFPQTNRRDLIQQELDAVKTSEGLYAYSNRLAKQRSK